MLCSSYSCYESKSTETCAQGRELKHLKALSQAVLQQRSDIELFLLSSLEMVRLCKYRVQHVLLQMHAIPLIICDQKTHWLCCAQVQTEIAKGHKGRREMTTTDASASDTLPAASHIDMRVCFLHCSNYNLCWQLPLHIDVVCNC